MGLYRDHKDLMDGYFRPGSPATRAREKTTTDYYAISGDWRYWYYWVLFEGNPEIEGPDDGWVPVSSLES